MPVATMPERGQRAETTPEPRSGAGGRWSRLAGNPERLVTLVVVAVSCLLVLWTLRLDLVFRTTTPTGGDVGADVWGPAFLREHLLANLRVSGWTDDWFAGTAAFRFTAVLPALLVVLLDVLLPYVVALKLTMVFAAAALPVAAWASARLARAPFPYPALAAAASLLFLYDTGFTTAGGNLASLLSGEYAFALGFLALLVYLGVLVRALTEKGHRAPAALLLAATALCSPACGLFAAAATVAAAIVYREPRGALTRALRVAVLQRDRDARAAVAASLRGASTWFLLPVGIVALAVGAFWSLPLVAHRELTTPSVLAPIRGTVRTLFPARLAWVLVLAGAGAVLGLIRQRRFSTLLVWLALFAGVLFHIAPWFDGLFADQLWNARFLPFWFFMVDVLAALGAAELVGLAVTRWPRHRQRATQFTPAAWLVVVLVAVGLPLGLLPGRDRTSVVPNWVENGFGGYERAPGWPEYRALLDTMDRVSAEFGCGRALWEYDEVRLASYGTPLALAALPYWTGGCIDSLEGASLESSPTAPFNFKLASEASRQPSRPIAGLSYRDFDVATAVDHMRLLGVRYYLTVSPDATTQALRLTDDLTALATSGPWTVWEIEGNALVAPMVALPYVEPGIDESSQRWLQAGESTWDRLADRRLYAAADGPDDWPRIGADGAIDYEPIDPAAVTVTDASATRVAFRVDQPGKPVLVRMSWDPNWQVSGANGPWRVTPNLMVVVPTAEAVTLTYGRTGVEWAGWVVTLSGLAGVVQLWRRDRRRRPIMLNLSDDAFAAASDAGPIAAPAPARVMAQSRGLAPPTDGRVAAPSGPRPLAEGAWPAPRSAPLPPPAPSGRAANPPPPGRGRNSDAPPG